MFQAFVTQEQQDSDQRQPLITNNEQINYASIDKRTISCPSSQQGKLVMKREQSMIPKHGYLANIFDRYSTSIYLENKGSVARDHLANERTYLAWLRTSLSTISVGIGITQLFRLEKSMSKNPTREPSILWFDGKMTGLLFIVIGMLFLAFACIRYFHVQAALVHGYFPSSRSTVAIASCVLLFPMTLMLISIATR